MDGGPGPPAPAMIKAVRGVAACTVALPLLLIAIGLYAEAHVSRLMMRSPWIYRIALRPRNAGLANAENALHRRCP